MFIGEKLTFLELKKTACTRTGQILQALPCCHGYKKGKHNRIYNFEPAERNELIFKRVIGGIRNPWDWYVSLWSFGCEGNGLLYNYFVKAPVNNRANALDDHVRKEWQTVLSEKTPKNFRAWLYRLLVSNRGDAPEGFNRTGFYKLCGYLTFCYFSLYTLNGPPGQPSSRSLEASRNYDEKYGFVDRFIRLEHLTGDVLKALDHLPMSESDIQLVTRLSRQPVNQSGRNRDYRHYYDEHAANLVAYQDRYIIDKHGYTF